jgi:hypothetical protein
MDAEAGARFPRVKWKGTTMTKATKAERSAYDADPLAFAVGFMKKHGEEYGAADFLAWVKTNDPETVEQVPGLLDLGQRPCQRSDAIR